MTLTIELIYLKELSDDLLFWPPLMIRCINSKSLGSSGLVGCCSIDHIDQYLSSSNSLFSVVDSSISSSSSSSSLLLPSSSSSSPPSSLLNEGDQASGPAMVDEEVPDVGVEVPSSSDLPSKVRFDLDLTVDSAVEGNRRGVGNRRRSFARNSIYPAGGFDETEIHRFVKREELKGQKKKKRTQRQMIADLDWWSKYYVSKEDFVMTEAKEKDIKVVDEHELENEDEESEFCLKTVDFTKIDVNRISEENLSTDATDATRQHSSEQQKPFSSVDCRRLMLRTYRQLIILLCDLKKSVVEIFSGKEFSQMKELQVDDSDDKSHVARIKFFDCELERIPEVDGFRRWYDTFRLFHGKKGQDDLDDERTRFAGLFKGKFCLYKIDSNLQRGKRERRKSLRSRNDHRSPSPPPPPPPPLRLMEGLPSHQSIEVRVIVYVIKGLDLQPVDLNGKADPYLVIRCGRNKVIDKKNRINNQLNPVFGRSFEFDVVFPMDSLLKVEVWDYDALSADDLIGETMIDLEDRFFSPHLARSGLQQRYEIFGYNSWRNPLRPSQILERLCYDVDCPQPQYDSLSVSLNGQTLYADDAQEIMVESENGEVRPTVEHLALKVLKNWNKFPRGCFLIPEHIETRSLYSPNKPGIEQGRLEMWVDMFPADCAMPANATVDVSPRTPKSYELRCIVWNTDDVTLDDVNLVTGEQSSDIFVKGFFLGKGEDQQQTDVHYRSLTGEGNFNWRFLFRFDYLQAEDRVVLKRKDFFLPLNDIEQKFPPDLHIQIWDSDLVSADDFLGSLTLNLNRIPKPAKSSGRCTVELIDEKSKRPTINLFKNKRCKGWWPIVAREDEAQGRPNASEERETGIVLKGKVELELHLLTSDEAEKCPAGFGRQEPDPLPDPNRPDTSFVWFVNPLKSLKYVIWHNYRWKIIKLMIIVVVIIFFIIFFYHIPGAIVSKMFFLGVDGG